MRAVRRILLAEGHGPTREFVSQSLAAAGFDVVLADDPQQAFELYASHRPAAVVLGADFAYPGGAALTQRLRDVDPRVLLVVADKEHLGKARGLQAVLPMKANAYVADPTGPLLLERLRHILSQSAAARPQLRGKALVLSRAPAARGETKPAVIARVLHQVWRSLSEGVLVLEAGDNQAEAGAAGESSEREASRHGGTGDL